MEKTNQIIGYWLVQAYEPSDVEEKVCTLLLKGWQPLGAPTIFFTEVGGYVYFQAMVAYKEKNITDNSKDMD